MVWALSPLPTTDFVCYSSSCFSYKVRLFIWYFSYFLREYCVVINFPLRIACCIPKVFGLLCFHFHLSIDIYFFFFLSSVIHWLGCSIFFSLHMFVFFYRFPPYISNFTWFLISWCCQKMLDMILIFLNLSRFALWQSL